MQLKRLHRILLITLSITLPLAIAGTILSGFLSYQNYQYQISSTNSVQQEFSGSHTDIVIDSDIPYTISSTEEENISITYPNNLVKIDDSSSSTLKIFSPQRWQIKGFWNTNWSWLTPYNEKAQMTINLPKTMKNVTINHGIGDISVDLSGIALSTFSLSGGVGNISLDNITVNQSINITGGIGNTNISQLNGTAHATIDSGIGNISLSTSTLASVDLSGGMGNVDIDHLTTKKLSTHMGVGEFSLSHSKIEVLNHEAGLGSSHIDSSNQIDSYRQDY